MSSSSPSSVNNIQSHCSATSLSASFFLRSFFLFFNWQGTIEELSKPKRPYRIREAQENQGGEHFLLEMNRQSAERYTHTHTDAFTAHIEKLKYRCVCACTPCCVCATAIRPSTTTTFPTTRKLLLVIRDWLNDVIDLQMSFFTIFFSLSNTSTMLNRECYTGAR